MKRSNDRILTSHVGSLPRPDALLAAHRDSSSRETIDAELSKAVADVVARQLDVGIDIVNDGEFGKPMGDDVDYGAFAYYIYDRLGGYEMQESYEMDWYLQSAEGKAFPNFYASEEFTSIGDPSAPVITGVCVAPITFQGQSLVERDADNLKRALPGTEDAFISSLAAGGLYNTPGPYYPSADDEAVALAEALREEYRAIVDAGLIVQIDNPQLVDTFFTTFAESWDLPGFRKWVERHVELVNLSLEGIPTDRVRCHVCWGSWKGPHVMDLPLEEAVRPMLKINAELYSIEAANPRHEHEWKVWEQVDLPDGKILMPGVVTHKTNIVEHPELVADRIIRYAELVGRENVIAGTDCGMGGRIHPEIAWAKLKVLSEGAALASERLWRR